MGEGSSQPTTVLMDMNPNGASRYEVSLQVTPKVSELKWWKSLSAGTRLGFRGRIASLFPVRVTRVGASSATLVVAVFIKDGELTSR